MAVQFGEEPTSEQRALIESAKGPWVLAVVATPTEIEGLSEPSVPRG